MTKKGFFKGVLKGAIAAAAIGAWIVSGPVAFLAVAGAVAAALVGGKVLSAAGSFVLQRQKLGSSNAAYPAQKGQKLTKGEAEFAESILGKKMQPERVRKYISPRDNKNASAETYGAGAVKFFGNGHTETDYSQPQDIDNAGVFIREMTNVFRDQNSSLLSRAFRSVFLTNKAEYELTSKSSFARLGNAQQASVIEDYARQFIYRENAAAMSDDKRTQLKKVVEKSFPQARRTRLHVETQTMRNNGATVKAEAVRFPIVVH